jgi:hypothetical protein
MIRIAGLLLLASAHALAANGFDAEVAARRAEAKRLAGRAEAIVPLLGILDGWALADDRGAIAAALDEVRADRRQRFEVRARATYLASIVAERMGDRARGQALRGELGLLGQWQVVGPFDNEGKSGHERVYGPEKELSGRVDPARGYPASIGGVQREVTWRRLAPERLAQGMVPLDAAL